MQKKIRRRRTPLQIWMDKKGLKDPAVAKRCKVDRSIISKVRRGLSLPSLLLARRIDKFTDGAVKDGDYPKPLTARAPRGRHNIKQRKAA